MQKAGNKAIRLSIGLQAKACRAAEIKSYMEELGFKQCVCFSCGNASAALKDAGVATIAISPKGDLEACRWWTMAEIKMAFPTCFDATSGHLPIELMNRIAKSFKMLFKSVIKPDNTYIVPTGSGETIICLKLAFPNVDFIAEYSKTDAACLYEADAPLAGVISSLFKHRII